MAALCCISIESFGVGGFGNESPEQAMLSRNTSMPDSGTAGLNRSDSNAGWPLGSKSTVAGILYKWTNYGKGWRFRWLLLHSGILSYANIHWPGSLNLLTPTKDVRIIGEISTLHLSTIDAGGGRRNHQKNVGIVHLKVANIEAAATRIHDGEYQLTNHEFSADRHKKFSKCSSTGSSDDIERKELEDVSDKDEITYYNTSDYFTEQTFSCDILMGSSDCKDKCCKHERQYDDVNMMQTENEFCNLQKEFCISANPSRRKKLPDPVEKEKRVSLWSIIKDNVGKDLTRVCLPVYFNEPLSSLQKCCEDLEYSHLLDRAYEYGQAGNNLQRILNVAAFAVSAYASSEGRECKPFNPLLGETYEADYPEKGIRFFSEKVCHHPTMVASHCEGKGWKFWGDSNLRSKCWGVAIQLNPIGILTLEFEDGEIFQWSKVTTNINNLILGKVYCDHHGTMHIRGNRLYSCKLKFKEHTILDQNHHQVHGYVEDNYKKKVATLFGKWDESIYYIDGKASEKPKSDVLSSDARLLWKKSMPSFSPGRYNLTSFAITLNELTPELKEKLPPTDSRLRSDQRHLENGEYEKADAEKQRLERRQRISRKLQENGWKPRWFKRDGEDGPFRYVGGYWEAREEGNWDGCPNIFGALDEDFVHSFKIS